MSEKKNNSSVSFYVPLVFIVAFILGCFSVSLIGLRESVFDVDTQNITSGEEEEKKEPPVKKSQIFDSGGMKYRMVSASDLMPGNKSVSPSKQEQEEEEIASSEPEEQGEAFILKLPMEHYINFVPTKKNLTAYLTFDDGPSENTEAILDILDYYNVKATFFVIYHKDREAQYKAIVNGGHTIGLHSYTHDYSKVYAGESAFFGEMEKISDYVYQQTGVRTNIMRFPGGSSNTISKKYSKGLMPVLKKSVDERGYVYHDWNVDSCDAERPNTSPERLLANIKNSLTKYDTANILMHDGGSSTRTTVEALPMIIEYIYSQGYSMEALRPDSPAVHHNW